MLLCPSDGRACESIPLPDGERVVLGRGPTTKIADKRCSREHLALTADYAQQRVLVEQVGPNPSQVGGTASGLLHSGQSAKLRVTDSPDVPRPTVSFLDGKFEYIVVRGSTPQQGDPSRLPDDTCASGSACAPTDEPASSDSSARKRSSAAAANLDGFVTVKSKRHSSDSAGNSADASGAPGQPTAVTALTSAHGIGERNGAGPSVSDKLKMYQDKMKSGEERRQQGAATPQHKQEQGGFGGRLEGVAASVAGTALSDGGQAAPSALPAECDSRTSAVDKVTVCSKPSETVVARRSGGFGEGWSQPFAHLYVYVPRGLDLRATTKVASFDLDGTLIVTASGKKWPQNKDDWTLLSSTIPQRLQQLRRDGHLLVVFTNQHGLAKGTLTVHDFKLKIEAITKKIGSPMLVLTATGLDVYRKPAPGMWNYLLSCIEAAGGGGGSALSGCSVYVGDAAGRPDGWAPKKKKDFACSDRLFALNLGLRFHTPEEFFFGHSSAPYSLPSFCPGALLKNGASARGSGPVLVRVATAAATSGAGGVTGSAAAATEPPRLASAKPELVLLAGYPASGKSHFAQTHMAARGYTVVNRDTLGTWQKCVKACDEALAAGRSVVVDNTNPDPASREKYVECARRCGVPCRCFMFDCGHDHALHNERFRQITASAEGHAPISDMVMNMHRSKFKEPELSEGFAEIVSVRFTPSFASAAHERLYGMYIV